MSSRVKALIVDDAVIMRGTSEMARGRVTSVYTDSTRVLLSDAASGISEGDRVRIISSERSRLKRIEALFAEWNTEEVS